MRPGVLVIGGGPAGMACAVQLLRSGFPVTILHRDNLGGLVREANLVENYPGFPGGITGWELANLMERQVDSLGIFHIQGEVIRLRHDDGLFLAITHEGSHRADICVVATGTRPNPPTDMTIDDDAPLLRSILPLREKSGKRVLVVGGGEAALDYGLSLDEWGNSVTVLVRGNTPKAIPALIDRAARLDIRTGIHVENIHKRGVITKDGESLDADHVVLATGREPDLGFLVDIVQDIDSLTDNGRLYFCGDVTGGIMRQCAIAAGDGVKTAMKLAQLHENT